MTDRYLVDKIKKEFPWLDRVYINTSRYIHLSEKHFFNTIKTNPKKNSISISIGKSDDDVPKEIIVEAIDAMIEITKLLLGSLYQWYIIKENPHVDNSSHQEYLKSKNIVK